MMQLSGVKTQIIHRESLKHYVKVDKQGNIAEHQPLLATLGNLAHKALQCT